jgi:hypothetical protein
MHLEFFWSVKLLLADSIQLFMHFEITLVELDSIIKRNQLFMHLEFFWVSEAAAC